MSYCLLYCLQISKQTLSIKKLALDQSFKSQTSQTKDAKKAVKRSLSHTSKEDDQVDPSEMVAEVQRLLAAVSKEGRSERDQSTVKEAMIAGDKRTFNMKDRDVELLKAMEDEEAIALEAEKVRTISHMCCNFIGGEAIFESFLYTCTDTAHEFNHTPAHLTRC